MKNLAHAKENDTKYDKNASRLCARLARSTQLLLKEGKLNQG